MGAAVIHLKFSGSAGCGRPQEVGGSDCANADCPDCLANAVGAVFRARSVSVGLADYAHGTGDRVLLVVED